MNPTPIRYFGLGLAILAVAPALGGVARAQEQSVVVTGEAERLCLLGPIALGGGVMTNIDTLAGSVLTVSQLADPQTMRTRAAAVTLTADIMCNTSHLVTLSSENSGLFRTQSAPSNGFGHAVPYQIQLSWVDEEATLAATAASRQRVETPIVLDRPHAGDLTINFSIQAGATNAGSGYPLLAGEYSDVLRLTVGPN